MLHPMDGACWPTEKKSATFLTLAGRSGRIELYRFGKLKNYPARKPLHRQRPHCLGVWEMQGRPGAIRPTPFFAAGIGVNADHAEGRGP